MMKTDEKLKRLFDYQKFENNRRLKDIIFDVNNECKTQLSDDLLVSVAGGTTVKNEKQEKEDKDKFLS